MSEVAIASQQNISQLAINTIRTLSIDAVQQANSGHPGAPMGLAPVVYELWQKFLRYDPANPLWPNRDRFILSAGHASMLLYSTLHLAGVKAVDHSGKVLDQLSVPMEEIKRFRQIDSRTPGHPESHLTTGVETTTGPLGQGAGNSVGMAIAGKWLAANYNKPGFTMFDYSVYAVCGDGDIMEGVCCEAASLAGHLKLGNLCWIYDNNRVTLDGPASWSLSEDPLTRFKGYGWNTLEVKDANNLEELAAAYQVFKNTNDRPTLIVVDSHIGYGSPHKQDSYEAHGEPLGEAEVKLAKKSYGWPEDAKFLVPEGIYEDFKNGVGKRGAELSSAWTKQFNDYAKQFPGLAANVTEMQKHELPAGWDKDIPSFPADAKGMGTRESSGKALNAIAKNLPWFIGGSADLAKSNKTNLDTSWAGEFLTNQFGGRNVHYGVREHAMGAAMSGMALCGLRPFGGTFFNFSDYNKPAIRLAALMELPVIFVFTHDSIGLGEDGPTHQPIEQLAGLRAMPNILVMRPGDANEVAEAYRAAVAQSHRPTAMVLSRQAAPTLDRTKYAPVSGVAKGGYVLADATNGKPDIILIGTGTELSLCVDAYEKLKAEGINARVVSLPCVQLFEEQDAAYKESVLPSSVTARVSVEMASTFGWERYIGLKGKAVGMRSFGASAPIKDLLKKFGFTVDVVVSTAKSLLGK